MTTPETAHAKLQDAGRTCPYCRFAIKVEIEIIECWSCHALHHAECWQDNGGCAVMGCVATQTVAAPQVGGAVTGASAVAPRVHAPPSPPQPPTPAAARRSPVALVIGGAAAIGAAVAVAVVLAGGSTSPPSDAAPPPDDVSAQNASGGAPDGGDSLPDTQQPPVSNPDVTPTVIVASVARTCGADGASDCFVSLRARPTGNSSDRRHLKEGAQVRVVCQRHGAKAYSSVLGRSSDVWTRTMDGLYLANVYLQGNGLDPDRITLPVCT